MSLSWLRMENAGQDGRDSQICDRVDVAMRKGWAEGHGQAKTEVRRLRG